MTTTVVPSESEGVADAVSAARIIAGSALIGAGLIHLAYAGVHLQESGTHGAFFVTVAWLQLGFGALVLAGRGGRGWLLAAAAVDAGVIAVWVVSRTAGIDGVVEEVGFADVVASALAAVAVAGCVRIAMSPRGWFPISAATRGAVAGASVMAVGMLVTASLVPAVAGTHEHGDGDGHGHGTEVAAAHAHAGDDAEEEGHAHDEESGASDDGDGHAHDDEGDSSTEADDHGHESAAGLSSSDAAHDDHAGGIAPTATDAHDHADTTTTTAHDHGDTTTTTAHDHGATTTTTSHDHGGGGGDEDDWETVRRSALIGGASEAKILAVQAQSSAFLADKIRSLSAALKKLPAKEREARIAMFVKWTIDHAVDSEHSGNHTHGPASWIPMGADDTVSLQSQLRASATVVTKYPTAADAMKAGYFMVTPWVPGIGAHYFNVSLINSFDPAKPSMLLYNGNSPSSELVGISHTILSNNTPSGFTGPNDVWHEHPQLCLIGSFVAGGDHTPPELCSMIGGAKGNGFGGGHLWMMHLWQVPGWESAWGLFSGENPALNIATTDVGR